MHADITVMVVDDHEIVRRGVAEVIDRELTVDDLRGS